MNRRDFLLQQKKKPAQLQVQATGLNTYAGPWTAEEVRHLLKRTMFGAKKEDVDYFAARSLDETLNELLSDAPAVLPPLRDYGLIELETGTYDDLGVPQGQTWVNDLNRASDAMARNSINAARVESLRKWWAGLILNQQRNISEKMVLFWHHHFSVQKEEVEDATLLYRHHLLLRNNVLGNARELTKLVATDPAMLRHLNGYLNSKRAPDENFARELQELMTVGKGNDSAYTEDDVIAAARVLTGWRIDAITLTAFHEPNEHDSNPKTFSSFYKNTTINGSDGQTEVNQLMDMIFGTTETARFLCRKLYKWLVYYQIDAELETNVIAPLAELFIQHDFDVKPVLKSLLGSEHFFDANNRACYIKSPYDFIAGVMREFNTSIPPYTDYVNGYPLFDSVYKQAAGMQQILFQPPDVSGWPSYYQEPMHYELWVNSNSLPKRANFTNALVADQVLDLRAFAEYSSDPANPDQLLEDIVPLLFRYPLSVNARNYIKTRFLLNNSTDNALWTNAWNSNNGAVTEPALRNMFSFLLNLPEFHLC